MSKCDKRQRDGQVVERPRTATSTLLTYSLTHLLALVALKVIVRIVPVPDAHRPLAVGTVVDVGEREEVLLMRVLGDVSAFDRAPKVLVVNPVRLVCAIVLYW